jgi:hypothetical protein
VSSEPERAQEDLGAGLLELHACPRRRVIFDRVRLEWGFGGCWLPSCSWCGHSHARLIARAISLSRPDGLLTLESIGDTWQDQCRVIRGLVRAQRRGGRSMWLFWAVEAGPFSGLPHVHAFVRGILDLTRLYRYFDRVGLAYGPRSVVYLPSWNRTATSRGYLFKGVLRWPQGSPLAQAAQYEHYELNNGHWGHQSQGFFLGPSGEPITKAAALRLARCSPSARVRSRIEGWSDDR